MDERQRELLQKERQIDTEEDLLKLQDEFMGLRQHVAATVVRTTRRTFGH